MPNISPRLRSAPALAIAAVALLGIGGAVGVTAASSMEPRAVMANVSPTAIKSLANAARPWIGEPIVTVRGRVTQRFGNRFILNDGTGQVLVDVGGHESREGGITANQSLTVQGHYEDGTIRPLFLVGPDGRVAMIGRGDRHGGKENGRRGDRETEHGSRDSADGASANPQSVLPQDANSPATKPAA